MSFQKIQHFEDGNWLQIYFNIKNRLGQWQTTNPCLMTWDVKRIIRWLKNLAMNNKLE